MTKVGILCEGCELEVGVDAIRKSPILVGLFEQNTVSPQIKIDNISLHILRKILEFCERHANSTAPTISRSLQTLPLAENGVEFWDAQFVELDSLQDLVDLTVCADFLEIPDLVNLCCAKIASLVKQRIPTVPCAQSASNSPAFDLGRDSDSA